MSDPFGIGAILTSVPNWILSDKYASENRSDQLYQFNTNVGLQRENMDFQRLQFNYQKQLNNILQSREDNAISRRAADMRRAGLSPVLAAGSAASASPLSSTSMSGMSSAAPTATNQTPPQFDFSSFDPIGGALNIATSIENLNNMKAQKENINAQTQKTLQADIPSILQNIENSKASIYRMETLLPYEKKKLVSEIEKNNADIILRYSQSNKIESDLDFQNLEFDYVKKYLSDYGFHPKYSGSIFSNLGSFGHFGEAVQDKIIGDISNRTMPVINKGLEIGSKMLHYLKNHPAFKSPRELKKLKNK